MYAAWERVRPEGVGSAGRPVKTAGTEVLLEVAVEELEAGFGFFVFLSLLSFL